jgi:hypothetical protein
MNAEHRFLAPVVNTQKRTQKRALISGTAKLSCRRAQKNCKQSRRQPGIEKTDSGAHQIQGRRP